MAQQSTTEMPFLDHLEELRWRIIWSLLALVGGIAIGFFLVLEFDAIAVLEGPILPLLGGKKLVYTHPGDPFRIVMSTAAAIGTFLALPVILYQIWAFVAPALYRHERYVVIPVLLGGAVLFLTGVGIAYFLILPLALRWLLGFQTASLDPMITAGAYFDFVVSMTLAFGLAFEMPIVILALSAFGVVTPRMLTRFRRHAFVLCFVLGALLTPGDIIWTTLAMAGPLYLLYELSIVLSFVVDRRRRRRAAAAAAAAG